MAERMKKLSEKWKNLKNKELLLSLVIGALILIIFFGSFQTTKRSKTEEGSSFTVEGYVNDLETRLENILRKIEGAGDVDVMVTVTSGMESVPFVKEDGSILFNGGKMVILKENFPKVTGVVVVAEGASSYTTKMQILGATVSLLDVSVEKVQIYTKSHSD